MKEKTESGIMSGAVHHEPLVSIVIPVYNRAEMVNDTLMSVFSQTYRPFRLILVDNNSTDDTLMVLRSYIQRGEDAGIQVQVLQESKQGACAARNKGLSEVTTPWVMFFDSDDVMMPHHLEHAMEAIAKNPDAEIVGWDIAVGREDGSSGRRRLFETKDIPYNNLMHGSMSTQRYMARTALIKAVGGWNNDVPVWNDIELGARILARNPHVVKINGDISVFARQHDASITGVSYAAAPRRYEPALRALASTLSPSQHVWIDLKRVILAADIVRGGCGEGYVMMEQLLKATRSASMRLLWKAVYRYKMLGGRGAARILGPWLSRR